MSSEFERFARILGGAAQNGLDPFADAISSDLRARDELEQTGGNLSAASFPRQNGAVYTVLSPGQLQSEFPRHFIETYGPLMVRACIVKEETIRVILDSKDSAKIQRLAAILFISMIPDSQSILTKSASLNNPIVGTTTSQLDEIPQTNNSKLLKGLENLKLNSAETALLNKLLLTEPDAKSFDDIKGQDAAVKGGMALKEQIAKPDSLKNFGVPISPGALHVGPVGTGKTSLASVIASQVEIPMFVIDRSAIFDGLVGGSEKKITAIFDLARKVASVHPSGKIILFFDEVERIAASRTNDVNETTKSVLGIMLQQTSNIKGSINPFIIMGATKSQID